jgi:shikimate dehydrogenase
MHGAAFTALGLDWAYVPLSTPPEQLEEAVGLVALGFAGANVTTPHKLAVAALCVTDRRSVNTLVVRDGVVEGSSTDAAILAGLEPEAPVILGDGACDGVRRRSPAGTAVLAEATVAALRRGRGRRRQRDLGAR